MIPAKAPTLVVGGKTLPPAQVILPVELAVGRENPTAQPNANSLAFSYLGDLPVQFLRGAPVNLSLLGYEEPGWTDVWEDRWSSETSTPGVLPPPTPEGFNQWTRFWGWQPNVLAWYENAGADLLTQFPPGWTGDAVWQGQVVDVSGQAERTLRASVWMGADEATLGSQMRWELLCSQTPNIDYLTEGTTMMGGPYVQVPPPPAAGAYNSVEFTIADDVLYVRLNLRVIPTLPSGDTVHAVRRFRDWAARFGPFDYSEQVRFKGTVTDLSSQVIGAAIQTQVQCIGMLAQFGDRYIGDTPWPVETDQARAARIATLLPADAFIPNGSAQVSLNARDVDRRKAADVLREQTQSTGALLWEAPDGTIHYDASEARGLAETPPPRLNGDEIIADAEWRQEMSRYLPRVLIEYGLDPGEGAEKPIYTAGAAGAPETKINTDLSDLPSATLVGDLIVRRWGDPTIWDAPRVHSTTMILTQASYEALLSLLPGQVIETDLMADAPAVGGQVGRWFVEGWTETWDRPGGGTNADLVHDLSLAVSDYRRFTLAGDPPGLSILVAPSWTFDGPDVTVTVTMDETIVSGTVVLSCGGRQIAPARVPVAGVCTWVIKANVVPVGDQVLEASFSGVFAYWQADTALAPVTVHPSDAAAQAFTVTPNPVNNGSNVTLAVTVAGIDGLAARGRVTWAYSKDGAGFVSWYTDVLAAGTARRTWKANSPASTWAWRATFTPDAGQGLAQTVSDVVDVDVLGQTVQTLTYIGSWQAVYDGTGAERPGMASLVQGRHSSGSYGDQRSLVGFSVPPADWDGWTITKVEAYLFYDGWAQTTGTAKIGSHTYDAKPASAPVITARVSVAKWGRNQGKWVDVTAWGKPLASGGIKGIAVGPANSTSTLYYGTAQGITMTNKPKVRITGSRWV